MLHTVKERLTQYLEIKKISKSEFGRVVGVSSAYVSSITRTISPRILKTIGLKYPDLNIEWLLTGEGEMLKGQSGHTVVTGDVSGNGNHFVAGNNNHIATPAPKAEDVEEVETVEVLEAIPIVTAEQAKKPDYNIKALVKRGSPEIERISITEFFVRFGDFDAIVPTYRDSMLPMYMPGDFLFVKYRQVTNSSYIKQGKYLVDTRAYGSILCFAEDKEDGTLELTFKNTKKYKAMRLPKEEVLSIADIVLMVRLGDMTFDVIDEAYYQKQLDVKDQQHAALMEQYGKTGDRVNRIIDQNQHLIENNQRMFEKLLEYTMAKTEKDIKKL